MGSLSKQRTESEIDHARHDPATALASLFRPITKGRRPGGLEIESSFDGVRLRFAIWRALDTRDQSVLLAAIGMAGIEGLDLGEDAPGTMGQQLWLDLKPAEKAKKDQAVAITTTRYALLKAAGITDQGKSYGLLEECLWRLSMVGCRASADGFDWSMQLLSYAKRPDGRLHIALNGRFAKALSGQSVRVSLDERRQLHGESAQIAHAWLSAWMRPGQCRRIRVDTLASRIWGKPGRSDATQRRRRSRTQSALEEIQARCGWKVQIDGRGKDAMAHIKRNSLIENV